MERLRWTWMLGWLAVAAPGLAVAQAQEYADDVGVTGPVVWNLGGTLLVPVGDSEKRSNLGGGFVAGLTFNANRALGLQLEYGIAWSSLKTGDLPTSIDGGSVLQYIDMNVVLRPGRAGRVGFYFVGGGGLYYRKADISRVDGTTVAPYCDPWLLYCSAVPVQAETLLGSRSSWDWGLDAGVGFTFAVAPPLRMYVEARYHYIFGPSFTDSTGQSRSANGQYIPITLGIQF